MVREEIKRYSNCVSLTFVTGTSLTSAIDISQYSMGTFKLPSGFKSLKIFFKVAQRFTGKAGEVPVAGDFARAREQGGASVSCVIPAAAGRTDYYPIPASVMAARALKFEASTAQTSAGKVLGVSLKG